LVFHNTSIPDVVVVELEPRRDPRGYFERVFCANEFKEAGLVDRFVQTNFSFTEKKHTLRGMHYQVEGAEEVKLVMCPRGRILDTVIDMREDSPTFGAHEQVELSQDNHKLMYVPEGFAHGFLTLEPNSAVLYHVSQFYAPGKERGVRWNDPFFNIPWPVEAPNLSEKDASLADFKPKER
jgi:dTDP-4-dehydrorhamnose 3,5-epimerase